MQLQSAYERCWYPIKPEKAYNQAMLEDYLRYQELTNVHLLTDPLVCVDHDYGMNCQKCCMLHWTCKLLKRNSNIPVQAGIQTVIYYFKFKYYLVITVDFS